MKESFGTTDENSPDTPVSGHNIPEWSVTLFVPNLTDCQDYFIINYKDYLIMKVCQRITIRIISMENTQQ